MSVHVIYRALKAMGGELSRIDTPLGLEDLVMMLASPATRYILIATVLFTALNICVKYLPHIPTSELVFFRGLVTLVISAYYARKHNASLFGNKKSVLVLRGLFGTVSLFALFYCLQKIPLAMATVISNLAPLFTVLIAHYFLKERATWVNWVLLVVAFLGVLFIKGWDPNVSWDVAMIGVLGSFMAACAYTCVRVLRTSEHPIIVIFYFQFISVPLMLVPMIFQWVTPSWTDGLLILTIGILTQIAQYFMTLSYQLETAAKVMVYNYAGVVWSIALGAVLFNEIFAGPQFLGVILIFMAIVASAIYDRKKSLRLSS